MRKQNSDKDTNSQAAPSSYKALESLLNDKIVFQQIVDVVFNTIDIDKSGTIDYAEIEKFIICIIKEMGAKKAPLPELVRQTFNRIDTDNSGFIDKPELAAFLRDIFQDELIKLKEEDKKNKPKKK